MLLEHSMQGYVDLAFPDKRLEVIGLSAVKFDEDDQADVAATIRYELQPARLDIQTGPVANPSRQIWIPSYPRISPWRDNTYTRIRSERRILVDINPDVAIEDNAVFFVYAGGRVVRKETTAPWVFEYLPSGS